MEKNKTQKKIYSIIQDHASVAQKVAGLTEELAVIAQLIVSCLQKGGKILLMGNGGSAADCQHMAAELVGRFQTDRKAQPAIALTTDSSILTSIANDYGFESVFKRQIEALCSRNDVVIGISTSGNSRNVSSALEKANQMGAVTIGFSGSQRAQIDKIASHGLKIPSSNTARIQEMHILSIHIICEIVEQRLGGSK